MRGSVPILLAALVVAGCGRPEPPKTPVARIGGRTLTMEEIRAQLQTPGDPSQAQMRQFVQHWISDEVLYREAVNRGFDQSPDVNVRIEDLRRQLAINALLDREVYAPATPSMPDERVRAYYEAHAKEFVLSQDMALVSFALFKQRDAATSVRNSILKGMTWTEALNQSGPAVLQRVDSSEFTQQSLHPPELWRVAANASGNNPSFPVSTPNGYYVLTVWRFLKQGQNADRVTVAAEIRNRLTMEYRQQRFDSLLTVLRARQPIDVFITAPEADTIRRPASE
jgi:hypothetical protein